jgi:hypothetical protein
VSAPAGAGTDTTAIPTPVAQRRGFFVLGREVIGGALREGVAGDAGASMLPYGERLETIVRGLGWMVLAAYEDGC